MYATVDNDFEYFSFFAYPDPPMWCKRANVQTFMALNSSGEIYFERLSPILYQLVASHSELVFISLQVQACVHISMSHLLHFSESQNYPGGQISISLPLPEYANEKRAHFPSQ